MTEELRASLARLAEQAPQQPLDVEALSASARRRRRRRALAAVTPVLALLLALPVAATALRDETDSLSQPAAPSAPAVPLDQLQAVVDVQVVAAEGAAPTLAARAAQPAVRLDEGRTTVEVAFEALDQDGASFFPFPFWSQEVEVDDGEAVLGLGGVCGRGWTLSGRPLDDDPCAAALPVGGTGPGGEPTPVPLLLYPRSGDRQTAPGTYRTELPLDSGQLLRIEVLVTAGAPEPTIPPAEPGTTSVQVFFGETGSPDCSDVRAVERRVPSTDAVATAALRELFAGTTPEERAAGLVGYGPDTAGLLRSVRVEGGTAYVDLDAARFPGAFTTSCGGTFFLSTVTATLTQFPTVDRVVLALDGDPRELVEQVQGFCEEPGEPGGPCDATPFVSPGP